MVRTVGRGWGMGDEDRSMCDCLNVSDKLWGQRYHRRAIAGNGQLPKCVLGVRAQLSRISLKDLTQWSAICQYLVFRALKYI